MADETKVAASCVVDGSLLEGGGQVIRNAIAISALLNKSVQLVKIRAGRKNPGLRAQHLTGIQLVKQITCGGLVGGAVKSNEVVFYPGAAEKKDQYDFHADTRTAGSVCLLLQVSLPVLLYLPGTTRVVYRGGTNASWSPFIDYTQLVFKPVFESVFGASHFDIHCHKRGWFPRGGGMVELLTKPILQPLPGFNLTDRGQVVSVKGFALVSGALPMTIAERARDAAEPILRNYLDKVQSQLGGSSGSSTDVPIDIDVVKTTRKASPDNGTCMLLIATTSTGCVLAASALGEKRTLAEDLGKDCARDLIKQLREGGCVDEHMQDQLILFMALAKGTSRLLSGPLTLHTRTAIHWLEELTEAKFTVTDLADKSAKAAPTSASNQLPRQGVLVECVGIAYESKLCSGVPVPEDLQSGPASSSSHANRGRKGKKQKKKQKKQKKNQDM